jgi:hypothetical protein
MLQGMAVSNPENSCMFNGRVDFLFSLKARRVCRAWWRTKSGPKICSVYMTCFNIAYTGSLCHILGVFSYILSLKATMDKSWSLKAHTGELGNFCRIPNPFLYPIYFPVFKTKAKESMHLKQEYSHFFYSQSRRACTNVSGTRYPHVHNEHSWGLWNGDVGANRTPLAIIRTSSIPCPTAVTGFDCSLNRWEAQCMDQSTHPFIFSCLAEAK